MYIEYLTHEYFIRQPPVSTQGENDCVGIERVGEPLSADAEENLWKYGPFLLPLSVSPFLSMVYSIFLMLLALLLLFYEGLDVFTIKMLFTKRFEECLKRMKDFGPSYWSFILFLSALHLPEARTSLLEAGKGSPTFRAFTISWLCSFPLFLY